jgi:Phospholipase B
VDRYPFGAIDGKVTSARMLQDAWEGLIKSQGKTDPPNPGIQTYARLGPTHDDQPPFCWNQFDGDLNRDKRNKPFRHVGQPECFNFKWVAMPPQS